jgi:porphobilinogen synthase
MIDVSATPAPALQGDRTLFARGRRLRRTPALRSLVRETRLDPAQLVAPLFVRSGTGVREAVDSMPGVARLSVDEAIGEIETLAGLGVGGVLLFGIPDDKDDAGSGAWASNGAVQETLRRVRELGIHIVMIADTCLCEYTDHGHCGPLRRDGVVDNDHALERLAQAAVSQAEAGADIVAPSAMMDGQVRAIRAALDAAGHLDTAIMAYAAKTASAFYGPFREAAGSTPAFGDRRGYQMDPANGREAVREMSQDVEEGADLLLIKPGLPCLDHIAAARAAFDLPVAAYQVSGEYAMIAAASERGWIDGRRVLSESITSIARAGADIVITYGAGDLARWIAGERAASAPGAAR